MESDPKRNILKEIRLKMNRLFFVILFLLGTQRIQANSDLEDIIINNKEIIISKLLSCSTRMCDFGPKRDTLINLLQRKNLNIAEKEKITKIYLFNKRAIIYTNSSSELLRDSINFKILIKALESAKDGVAIPAYDYLIYLSDINQLRKYNSSIKQAFTRASKISSERKVRLLALATDSLKNASYKSDTSLFTKALKEYMIDTAFENKKIAMLDTGKYFNEKNWAINDLILRGNRRCLNALILHFNDPTFELAGSASYPCTSFTLRIPIIKGLSRYFPDEPLLSDSLYSIMNSPDKINNRETVSLYFTAVIKWAKKEFGVEPKDPPLPPVICQGCRPQY